LVSGAPNNNDKGEVVGSIGIHFDLTEARSNLDLLQQKTEQLDIIFENASMGIVLSRNDTILKCNSTFAQMLNYEQSELEGGHYLSITTEEDRLKSQSYVARMEKGELDNFTLNKRYLKKDGSKIWSKTIVTSVKGPGNLPYHIALIEDITDERNKSLIFKMLNNLTTSILGKIDINEIAWEIVNILANYLESSDCIIYVVDWEKNCLEQIAAYGNKIDKSKNIVNKLTIPIGEGIVGRVAVTGKSELIGDTTKDPNYITDDKLRMSEITVPIIRNNKVIGVIDSEYEDKNYFNSEHLKTLESVASIVGIQLETAVNIRKREKAEAINKELLKQLTNSNNELQEYAHVVSHDLKSPLRSIDALIAWLKEDNNDNLDETSLKNLSLIEITLEKMEQLITDVLNYSSVSEINRQNEIFSSQELVDDVLKILFIPKHIKIHISKDLPIINGDKTKIQQVFINLISNAIKYNDKKEGIIKINTDETSSHYLFSVSDNGIGIDEKYHGKVFKLFHSLETRHDSTGIGLSVVKKIVGLHNGQIWLESELGIGSTFHFSIKK
jgi:PAS domain S-box-containing protein